MTLIELCASRRVFHINELKSSKNINPSSSREWGAFLEFREARGLVLVYPKITMALAAPYVLANEYDRQRAMQRQVMRFLHRLRNPRKLTGMPIVGIFCKAMGERDPATALEQVIRTVFAGDDESSIRLRHTILKPDFERAGTNAELARSAGVSRRHFQRLRAEAIGAVAQYARTLLEREQPFQPFARERAAFSAARDRGRTLEMYVIAGNLMRLAKSDEQHRIALESRWDAAVRLGKRVEAEPSASISRAARLTLAAKLALIDGRVATACQEGLAAVRAIEPRDAEWYRALAVLSQAYLNASLRWSVPAEAFDLPPRSWERVAMDVERARHLAAATEWERAHALACVAQRQAESAGYADVAARACAVLHSVAATRRDVAAANWWRALAIRYLLSTQDRLLATGLFAGVTPGPVRADDLLVAALYDHLSIVMPQMTRDDSRQRAAARMLLAAILEKSFAPREREACVHDAVARVRQSDGAFAHYAGMLHAAVRESVTLALVALTGRYWDELAEPISSLLATIAAGVAPSTTRAIAVALPQSQTAGIDHLKLNDERPAGRGESEAFADLRVRLVSV